MPPTPERRHLRTAEILSIGSELTVGETRDTNAGELARGLTLEGVTVGRIVALPDRLDVVTDAFATAFRRADLVVSTGGLGPTPDDLTRESIAAALGETPEVDPDLEAWLRGRWERRGMPFPEINLKQAWRIPSSEPLPNPNGERPGLVRQPARRRRCDRAAGAAARDAADVVERSDAPSARTRPRHGQCRSARSD